MMNPKKFADRWTKKVSFEVFDSPIIWPEHRGEIYKAEDGFYFVTHYGGGMFSGWRKPILIGYNVNQVNKFLKSINDIYSDCNLTDEDFINQ